MKIMGYRVILPAPWIRLPLAEGLDAVVRELVRRRTAAAEGAIPPDQLGPLRRQLETRLLAQAESARRAGGTDLFFPEADMHGLLIGASFVISEVYSPPLSNDRSETWAVVDALAGPGGHAVELDGTRFARSESVIAPGPDTPEVDVATRRVTYTAPRPDDPDRWVIVAFSCVGDGDPYSPQTAVVVDLFDAIMSTWTWSYAGEGVLAGER